MSLKIWLFDIYVKLFIWNPIFCTWLKMSELNSSIDWVFLKSLKEINAKIQNKDESASKLSFSMCEIASVSISAIFSSAILFAQLGLVPWVVMSTGFWMFVQTIIALFAKTFQEILALGFLIVRMVGVCKEFLCVILVTDRNFLGWGVIPQNAVQDLFEFWTHLLKIQINYKVWNIIIVFELIYKYKFGLYNEVLIIL